MDPGRRALMLSGRKSPPARDVTSPRRDDRTRISKPSQPSSSARARKHGGTDSTNSKKAPSSWMSHDDQAKQFVADEDKFVLKQAKKKADIRVREGRAKPIDILAFGLRFIDTDRDVFDDEASDLLIPISSPESVLQSLDEPQLRELDNDITSYHTLENNARNRDFWKTLQVLCADRRQKLKPQGPDERVVSTVAADIDKILSPKTFEQLEALETQVRMKLRSNEDIDLDYWEQLLRSLIVWKAKAKAKKYFESIVESRIAMLKLERSNQGSNVSRSALEDSGDDDGPVSRADSAQDAQDDAARRRPAPSAPSSSSLHTAEPAPPPGTARFAQAPDEDFSQATKALYEREVARGISENEEVFTAEETMPGPAKPQWADKYRPRKPRYFNRVQMGYEWNKYNQTHYDHSNPPPRVVQGYKFNIFYPELIDKTKAPTFKIIREHGRKRGESFAPAGEEDTCLIRFIAGPPYEDIAFRIVDREWDYSAKKERGFRSSFDKGILQLHFQFKKIFYRK